METLFYIIIILLSLPLLYTVVRLLSKAIFKSYFTEKRKEKENENEVC